MLHHIKEVFNTGSTRTERFSAWWQEHVSILWKDRMLFSGLVLIVIGLLNFSSGRFCEGNSADYYTCTQPATYYYYHWLAVAGVAIGVVLVALWFQVQRNK